MGETSKAHTFRPRRRTVDPCAAGACRRLARGRGLSSERIAGAEGASLGLFPALACHPSGERPFLDRRPRLGPALQRGTSFAPGTPDRASNLVATGSRADVAKP